MRRIAPRLLILVLVAPALAAEIRGKVVSISDGDTIHVLDSQKVEHKIRQHGIDAPEKSQAFGTKSKKVLSEKIGEKDVRVQWKQRDRYNRIVGDVYLGDRWINLEMVEDGMAWHYRQFSKSEQLAEAEKKARKEKRGLWADKSPEPPWEFRKKERERTK